MKNIQKGPGSESSVPAVSHTYHIKSVLPNNSPDRVQSEYASKRLGAYRIYTGQ